MIKKLKIISVLGTRPEFIKMSEVIKKFDTFYNHILINTNQNFEYELNKIFFKDLKLRSQITHLKKLKTNLQFQKYLIILYSLSVFVKKKIQTLL
jgi:UDP-N-acetylglucosamine 2-epimerase (non-hydrolysing)